MRKAAAMARIRTIKKAYEEISKADPNTCLTEHRIRQLAVNGDIPTTKAGSRYLLDMDKLFAYLDGEKV